MMKKIAVVTDSVANIPDDLVKKYDITVVPLYVVIDGVSYKEDLEIGPTDIYRSLLSGSQIRSSTPSIKDFTEAYSGIMERYRPDIIYSIHLSSALSGTINSASAAARILQDMDIRIVDSKRAAISEGFIALAVAASAKEGASQKEIDATLERMMDSSHFYATFDNFEYVVKGGRAPFLAKFVKRVMFLKPVIDFNDGGRLGLKKFCLNKRISIRTLFNLVKTDIIRSKMGECIIGICYGDDMGPAASLKRMVEDDNDIKVNGIVMTRMTSVMAAHTGPGIWGIAACPSFVNRI